MLYIGIDLGTSSVKLLLVDADGSILKTVTKEYPLYFPNPGWSEQNPDDWWDACVDGIKELTSDIVDKNTIAGIGCGGQMHGLVILDKDDKVIRPAILWNDGRTNSETDYLNNTIGKDKLSEYTANIAFAGFTAPKILWLKNNEPESYSAISRIMLPKDYINYRLTGVHSCDYSDASGMLLLDVKNKCWSKQMLDVCGITEKQLPDLYESYEITGKLLPETAELLGLSENVNVVAGAGDNAAAAIATGTVGEGACNISVGTSGTIFISSEKFGVDKYNGLHSFAHADGYYHLMGCILSAASCNKWFCEDILNTKAFAEEQSRISKDMLGRNRVFFLPYLMGERSPINDTFARGTFVGMTLDTSRADMLQAVYEGVAFAIRDCFEIAKSLGIDIKRSNLCGGGAKSPLWCDIFSNILNIEIDLPVTEEGPGYGGAMLAMTACGEYEDIKACTRALCKTRKTIRPDADISGMYEERYAKYREIYPAMKQLFRKIY